MEFSLCQQRYKDIVSNLNGDELVRFLRWVQQDAEEALKDVDSHICDDSPDVTTEEAILNQIQTDLREMVPISAVLPTENIVTPHGKNADCDPRTTVHVDGFLYDDETLDELVEDGKFSRNYCKICGSHQVSALTFVSHSTSKAQLRYMFQYLLPDLRGKAVVDVGSRLGPVLYGAYMYSDATHIVGIELSSDMCKIQQTIVEKFCMQDRIQVLCDDICNRVQFLAEGDVIVLNNVFEFFLTQEQQKSAWDTIQKAARKSGTLLVTSPSLQDSLAPLDMLHLLNGWVTPVDISQRHQAAQKALFDLPEDSDLEDIYLYAVV